MTLVITRLERNWLERNWLERNGIWLGQIWLEWIRLGLIGQRMIDCLIGCWIDGCGDGRRVAAGGGQGLVAGMWRERQSWERGRTRAAEGKKQ